MNIIDRKDYETLIKSAGISINDRDSVIDIYSSNNWDHFIMHWDSDLRNNAPSYIDFFFDAKHMVDFMTKWLCDKKFFKCYIASMYTERYKLKTFDDDVCRDVYDEFKILLNSLNLKINTTKAIEMDKNELIGWFSRVSIGGFLGVSEYSVLIPELKLLIFPHHHMNYLIYALDKNKLIPELSKITDNNILIEY